MATRFNIADNFLSDHDVHVHMPAGAVPKDGPSAGITVATALMSALSGRPARSTFAMTGEITLRGYVLAVGGVREKVLAAHRAGVTDVILPARNRKDEPEIPEKVREGIRLHYVKHVTEVFDLVLLDPQHDKSAAA